MMGMDQSQLMMFMALLNKNTSNSNNSTHDYYVIIITLLVFISPFIFTHHNKEYFEKIFLKLINFNQDYVKITFTSHEIPVRSYSHAPITKQIYSESMMALFYYAEKNKKIKNLNSMLEILTIFNITGGYPEEEREKNKFSYIPLQDEDILLFEDFQKNIEIYGNFLINENNNEDNNNNNDKTKTISVKKKTYQATIMIKKNKKLTDPNDNTYYLNILQDFMKNITEEYHSLFKEKDNSKLYIYVYRNSINEDNINRLIFDKHYSEHNKELNTNIFFEGKNDLIKYITPFIYNPNETTNVGEEKYKRLGCTFKAGLFFWGYPGCGKTSTIKAILKYTNRHGIYIDLKKIKTCEELETLFRVKKIHENEYCGKQLCFIMEDCDAAENNILKDRTMNESFSTESNSVSQNLLSSTKDKDTELLSVAKSIEETLKTKDDALNLSCFLNTLDGIIELHGIMVIMTSNHPEKIDTAVLREGRFDFKHEFKKASQSIIKEMLQHNFQLTREEMSKYPNIYNIKDYVLSPAKIQKICFKHNDVNSCINEIIQECQKV